MPQLGADPLSNLNHLHDGQSDWIEERRFHILQNVAHARHAHSRAPHSAMLKIGMLWLLAREQAKI